MRCFCHEIAKGEDCKVVIYNYILCWLYSMKKNVVIVLILFLVFCEILLYQVQYKVGKELSMYWMNKWILRVSRKKPTRERAT